MNHKVLALFDFDGTITKQDSFAVFLRHSISLPRLIVKTVLLSPVLLQYAFRLMANHEAKQRVFKGLYGGISERAFLESSHNFQSTILPGIIRRDAMERLKWHQQQGHEVCVVSAGFLPLLDQWCAANGLNLICTEIEIKDSKISGNFSSKNCHGIEKVRRIKEVYKLEAYDAIYAYGDTVSGDGMMLGLATHPFFRFFKG